MSILILIISFLHKTKRYTTGARKFMNPVFDGWKISPQESAITNSHCHNSSRRFESHRCHRRKIKIEQRLKICSNFMVMTFIHSKFMQRVNSGSLNSYHLLFVFSKGQREGFCQNIDKQTVQRDGKEHQKTQIQKGSYNRYRHS